MWNLEYGVRTVVKDKNCREEASFTKVMKMLPTEPENPPQARALPSTVGLPSQANGQRFVLSNFPVPQMMVVKGDLGSVRQHWEDYEVATELSLQTTAVQLGSLRSIMGKQSLQGFRTLSLSPEQQGSVSSCLDAS